MFGLEYTTVTMLFNCAHCGREVRRTPSQARKSKRVFCNRKCQNTVQGRESGIAKSLRVKAERTIPDSEQPAGHRVVRIRGADVTRVDIDDYDLALSTPWFLHTSGYAHSGKKTYLHRLVLQRMVGRELTKSDVADHINHDKLDNRRSNLRLATTQLNGANMITPRHNTSGFKGVRRATTPSMIERGYVWQANIKVDQKQIFVGHYQTAEEAAYGYDQFAIQLFGDFARTNFDLTCEYPQNT